MDKPYDWGMLQSPRGSILHRCQHGTAVEGGEGNIISTTDGGVTWTRQGVGDFVPYGIFFTDANTGTVVGASGTILRTTTGGSTWVQEKKDFSNPGPLCVRADLPNLL